MKIDHSKRTDRLLRIACLGMIAVHLAALAQTLRQASGSGEILGRFTLPWTLILAGLISGSILILALSVAGLMRPQSLLRWSGLHVELLLSRLGRSRWLLGLLAAALPAIVLLGSWGWRFPIPAFRLALFFDAALAAGLLWPLPSDRSRLAGLALGSLVTAAVFVAARNLVPVSSHPFALGWSEGNRLWDYSLIFGRGRYEMAGDYAPPSYLTPGRHGLWGLAFLVPGLSIAAARLWDALLWIAPALLLGWALFVRRLPGVPDWVRLAGMFWTLVFLSQGPIYAPLLVSAIILALGYSRAHPRRSLLVVGLACFYAGISRWTWMLAPAVWAAMLALVDTEQEWAWHRRLRMPFAFGLAGALGAAISFAVMELFQARDTSIFSVATSQPLLWYRLWPSATNPTGIVLGLVIAIGPLLALLAWLGWKRRLLWDRFQVFFLSAALFAFLVAGLVASVKIGGGNNLHNLDMLLVSLIFLSWLALRELVWPPLRSKDAPAVLALVFICLLPGLHAVGSGGPLILPTEPVASRALEQISASVREAANRGEVLFMDQRQLLTFGQVAQVPLVLDYELKHVMNQAMADNEAYFERFEADLAAGRFSLIVSDSLEIVYQGRTHAFGEENDAWVEHVTLPLLAYYEPVAEFKPLDVWLMAPRSEP